MILFYSKHFAFLLFVDNKTKQILRFFGYYAEMIWGCIYEQLKIKIFLVDPKIFVEQFNVYQFY